jgi:DNA end-binding protein Ku
VAARSMAKINIQMSLLNVPCQIFKATEDGNEFSLHQFSPAGNRIRYRRVDEVTGEEVPKDQIRKGCEVNGQVVMLDQDDQQALESLVPATTSWEIVAFVAASEINPLALSGDSYHIAPQPRVAGAEKAYVALAGAIRRSGKLAVTSMAMRGRVRPVVIGVSEDGVMIAQAVLYPKQLRQAPVVPSAIVTDLEASMMDDLVLMLSADHLDLPERDDYNTALTEVIVAKLESKPLPTQIAPPSAPASDLAAVLAASMASVKALPDTAPKGDPRSQCRGVVLNRVWVQSPELDRRS